MQESNKVKPDEFQIGDVVWCLLYGKGVIKSVDDQENSEFPIRVAFESGEETTYKPTGEFYYTLKRTLFFSEPKIEASVTRPFVPTLVGKRVVVRYFDKTWARHPVVVTAETEEEIFTKNGSDYKGDIVEIYEVSSENLLTSKK